MANVDDKMRYFLFTRDDVLKLLQYRIEYNHMFLGKRGGAIQGWKLVARKLNNGSNERHVAKKFSNLINTHNKHNSLLKQNPEYEINWPYFDVMKEAIRMLNSMKGSTKPHENYDESMDVFDDNDLDNSNDLGNQSIDDSNYHFLQQQFEEDSNELVAIKQEDNNDDFDEDDDDGYVNDDDVDNGEDNLMDSGMNLNQQQRLQHQQQLSRMWPIGMTLKLIQLRGIKYAKYFDKKDKSLMNVGWSKIHIDKEFRALDEKQLRKKWQNMTHRFKCIYETIERGEQDESGVSWLFYKPMKELMMSKDKTIARKQNPNQPTQHQPTPHQTRAASQATASLAQTSPTAFADNESVSEQPDVKPPPLIAITANAMANKMMQMTNDITANDSLLNEVCTDLNEVDNGQPPHKRIKIENVEENVNMAMSTSTSTSTSTSNISTTIPIISKVTSSSSALLSYQRRRDKILLTQNNNMLKLLKALVQTQGVKVPFEVTVDISQL